MTKSNQNPSQSQQSDQDARQKQAKIKRPKALNKVAAVTPTQPLAGFMNFVREQGVVGLAIGLALGVQVKALVDQIVASFINPMVGLFLPGQGNLSNKTFSLTIGEKTADFTYGAFINVLISFVAVAAVIYFVVKGLRLDKIDRPKSN